MKQFNKFIMPLFFLLNQNLFNEILDIDVKDWDKIRPSLIETNEKELRLLLSFSESRKNPSLFKINQYEKFFCMTANHARHTSQSYAFKYYSFDSQDLEEMFKDTKNFEHVWWFFKPKEEGSCIIS